MADRIRQGYMLVHEYTSGWFIIEFYFKVAVKNYSEHIDVAM
jgi:hypothetical protein